MHSEMAELANNENRQTGPKSDGRIERRWLTVAPPVVRPAHTRAGGIRMVDGRLATG